jgi:hypothetical protein
MTSNPIYDYYNLQGCANDTKPIHTTNDPNGYNGIWIDHANTLTPYQAAQTQYLTQPNLYGAEPGDIINLNNGTLKGGWLTEHGNTIHGSVTLDYTCGLQQGNYGAWTRKKTTKSPEPSKNTPTSQP